MGHMVIIYTHNGAYGFDIYTQWNPCYTHNWIPAVHMIWSRLYTQWNPCYTRNRILAIHAMGFSLNTQWDPGYTYKSDPRYWHNRILAIQTMEFLLDTQWNPRYHTVESSPLLRSSCIAMSFSLCYVNEKAEALMEKYVCNEIASTTNKPIQVAR